MYVFTFSKEGKSVCDSFFCYDTISEKWQQLEIPNKKFVAKDTIGTRVLGHYAILCGGFAEVPLNVIQVVEMTWKKKFEKYV